MFNLIKKFKKVPLIVKRYLEAKIALIIDLL